MFNDMHCFLISLVSHTRIHCESQMYQIICYLLFVEVLVQHSLVLYKESCSHCFSNEYCFQPDNSLLSTFRFCAIHFYHTLVILPLFVLPSHLIYSFCFPHSFCPSYLFVIPSIGWHPYLWNQKPEKFPQTTKHDCPGNLSSEGPKGATSLSPKMCHSVTPPSSRRWLGYDSLYARHSGQTVRWHYLLFFPVWFYSERSSLHMLLVVTIAFLPLSLWWHFLCSFPFAFKTNYIKLLVSFRTGVGEWLNYPK